MSQERAMKVGHSDDLDFSISGEKYKAQGILIWHRIMYYQANN